MSSKVSQSKTKCNFWFQWQEGEQLEPPAVFSIFAHRISRNEEQCFQLFSAKIGCCINEVKSRVLLLMNRLPRGDFLSYSLYKRHEMRQSSFHSTKVGFSGIVSTSLKLTIINNDSQDFIKAAISHHIYKINSKPAINFLLHLAVILQWWRNFPEFERKLIASAYFLCGFKSAGSVGG